MNSTDGVTIRTAIPADLDSLVELQCLLSEETEHHPLDTATARRGIHHLLCTPAIGRYLVAENDVRTIVGCLLVLSEWSTWRNGEVRWVHDVYVRKEWRGSGIFHRLYEHVRTGAAETPGVLGVRLYVNRENAHARCLYERLGMRDDHWVLYEWMTADDAS